MQITSRQFPDRFLIVPNHEVFFGEVRNEENGLDIIETFTYRDVAEIYMIRFGALGFHFRGDGPLRSIEHFQTSGSGMIPEHVMQNHDDIVALQGRRLVFANFIAAALFGRFCALRHRSLSGAHYAGMHEILGIGRQGSVLITERSRHSQALFAPKIQVVRESPQRVQIIPSEEINQAIAFVRHAASRESELEYANLQTCMVMNYQAAILHGGQHAAASLALSFAVCEALIHEIFLAYGIVGSRAVKPFATRTHNVAPLTNGAFDKTRLGERLGKLADGGLLDSYLRQRLDDARILRNNMMHRAAGVAVRESGTLLTAVRDLWSYVLDEEFELNMARSMRT